MKFAIRSSSVSFRPPFALSQVLQPFSVTVMDGPEKAEPSCGRAMSARRSPVTVSPMLAATLLRVPALRHGGALGGLMIAAMLAQSAPASAQPARSVVEAENRLRDLLGRSAQRVELPSLDSPFGSVVQTGPASALQRQVVGEWRRSNGSLRITELSDQSGALIYAIAKSPSGTEYQLSGRLEADSNGAALVGEWEHLNGDFQGGAWRLALVGDELVLDGFFATPHVPTFRFTRAAPTGPTPSPAPSDPPAQQPDGVVNPPAPAPGPAQPPPIPPAEQVSGFQPLRQFDVRLDRVVEARGYPTRQVHVFVTIKNASGRAQHITSGFLKALLSDADGVAQERNQVWRASGEPAALFSSTPVVQAGAELRIRYVFTPDEGSRPSSFTLMEGDRRAEFSVAGF